MFSRVLEQKGNFNNYDFSQDESKPHSCLQEVTLCPKLEPSIETTSYEEYINLVKYINGVLPKGIIFYIFGQHSFSFTYDLFPF